MAWQLIFKAPDESNELFEASREIEAGPVARRPVSMTLQLDPGTRVVGPAAVDDDDDDD